MSTTTAPPPTRRSVVPTPSRQITWRRIDHPATRAAVGLSLVASIAMALGTVAAGHLASHTTWAGIGLLALAVVGAQAVALIGRILWAREIDQAEGALRADLLTASMYQPLEVLTEQAVGEVLDRVDDDTHEVGNLLRRIIWDALATGFGVLPLYIVAGFTWWPAFVVFPIGAAGVFAIVRPMLPRITQRAEVMERSFTDHAAALEEGIAARDDVRTSLGQAYVVRRVAEQSAEVHRRFFHMLRLEVSMTRTTGVLLAAILAAVAVIGMALVMGGHLGVGRMVTLFLATSTFVSQIDMFARHLPDMQQGLGALTRLRQLLAAPEEPRGGLPVPSRPDLELRGLHFHYREGGFALHDIDLALPSGQTCALVGRTGSGKSTLASLVSRAVEPERGTVFLGGVDVLDLDLDALRSAVGVVTQRTEILAGSLAENIALFAAVPREDVQHAVDRLGLTDWVAGLPQGLDTLLGPGGTTLSAGEEQLVAFARLLVRDVEVVVLDEATARMDPVTEARVVRAADELLRGRTGLLVAHRLSTTERAEQVAVLRHGTVIQYGERAALARADGPFRDLLEAAAAPATAAVTADGVVGTSRRAGPPPALEPVPDGPSLAGGIWREMRLSPRWGLFAVAEFLLASVTGALGPVTGLIWGRAIEQLRHGQHVSTLTLVLLAASILAAPLFIADAFRRYPRWWINTLLHTRMTTLVAQTEQRRLPRTPPGEIVGRLMDGDRYPRYADRWVDFVNGLLIVFVTGVLGGTALAGAVLLAVMVGSATASLIGRPIAGRAATAASATRARFGRALVSTLDSIRTVKLAAATGDVHAHLTEVDAGRVAAAVREHRVEAILQGLPLVMVQVGVVAAWVANRLDVWSLAITLMVAGAVSGFDWFGRVAGTVITEAPGTRSWQRATIGFAGGRELMDVPAGVDVVGGTAPLPGPAERVPLDTLTLRGFSAVHDDGTVGADGVDLELSRGELVLVLGQVGSGKSSLLAALAGLVSHAGTLAWNGRAVTDPETFLRPCQVAYVAQLPRVLSGTYAGNIDLDHGRDVARAIQEARLGEDVSEAGGPDARVGHRGVRLSGGQVQRLALARALATDSELLLADDVSSALDAATERELWAGLKAQGRTVLGSTSKTAALAQADRVVVLTDGRVAETGPWSDLAPRWGHLAG